MNNQEPSAVSKGPHAMVIRTLATAVRLKAIMKAVNMMLQHKPDSQKYGLRHGRLFQTLRPCQKVRMSTKPSTVKALRQNVISKPRALSKWRETTPAMDHKAVTSTIKATA
jgi:hypothetical protein